MCTVVTFAVTWIEIVDENGFNHVDAVVTFAVTWIEIEDDGVINFSADTSSPSR